jgi:hypothetical protein
MNRGRKGSRQASLGTKRPMSVMQGRPVEKVVRPFQEFAHRASSGGLLLIATMVVALVRANSSWWDSYAQLWGAELRGP